MKPALLALAAFLLAACAYQKPATFSQFALTGEITRLDPSKNIAEIKHEDIKNDAGKLWMAAMTMEFPVKDPAEFARLKTGQRIKATVHQNDADLSYWIAGITELPPPAKP